MLVSRKFFWSSYQSELTTPPKAILQEWKAPRRCLDRKSHNL